MAHHIREFRFKPSRTDIQKVTVTGSFDSWAGTNEMHRNDDGFFTACVPFDRQQQHRRVLFKFIVDGEWMCSPDYPTEPDAAGNINNCISIPASMSIYDDDEKMFEKENLLDSVVSMVESPVKCGGDGDRFFNAVKEKMKEAGLDIDVGRKKEHRKSSGEIVRSPILERVLEMERGAYDHPQLFTVKTDVASFVEDASKYGNKLLLVREAHPETENCTTVPVDVAEPISPAPLEDGTTWSDVILDTEATEPTLAKAVDPTLSDQITPEVLREEWNADSVFLLPTSSNETPVIEKGNSVDTPDSSAARTSNDTPSTSAAFPPPPPSKPRHRSSQPVLLPTSTEPTLVAQSCTYIRSKPINPLLPIDSGLGISTDSLDRLPPVGSYDASQTENEEEDHSLLSWREVATVARYRGKKMKNHQADQVSLKKEKERERLKSTFSPEEQGKYGRIKEEKVRKEMGKKTLVSKLEDNLAGDLPCSGDNGKESCGRMNKNIKSPVNEKSSSQIDEEKKDREGKEKSGIFVYKLWKRIFGGKTEGVAGVRIH